MNHPQIQQLREIMMQNPALAQPLIQELAQANPGLAQLFAQNPEALAQVLGADLGDDEEAGPVPPGAQVVHVTPEERAAIERVRAYLGVLIVTILTMFVFQLEALGFSREAVVEAYFACDKNEEMAANFLFDSNFES